MPAQQSSFLWRLWIFALLSCIALGVLLYLQQFIPGYHHNVGLSRDVSWGLHISQFTYFVGVAASSVVLLLPAFFHNYSRLGPILLLGETLAVTALVMASLFILVDIGQPQRVFNILLHPSLSSPLFWDMVVIGGYLLVILYITKATLDSRRFHIPPPERLRKVVYLSIFWAFSIHTVTALIYSGLPGRHYWLTAIMAARFLASAFCSGPAILLLLCLVLKRLTGFDPGKDAARPLVLFAAYAMAANIFFFLLEIFTTVYSGAPTHALTILFSMPDLWPTWAMRAAVCMGLASFLLLAFPATRESRKLLPVALALLVASTWLDKGLLLMIGGFSPNPFGRISVYTPTSWEIGVAVGIYALGALIVSVSWKEVAKMEMGRRKGSAGA